MEGGSRTLRIGVGVFTVLNNMVQEGLDDKRDFNRTYNRDPEG